MFPYYPFYNNFTHPHYTMHSHHSQNTYNRNSYFPINFANQMYQQYAHIEKNHHETLLQKLQKNLQYEKCMQIKQQAQKFPIQAKYSNQIFSISSQQVQQNPIKISKISKHFKPKQSKKKIRNQKKDKAYVAKQYPKQQPSIKSRYIQKNFELNIINQVFSFLWTEEKSFKFVKRFLKDDVKISLFYEFIKIVRKFSKRYINKQYLKNLCNYQPNHIAYKMVTKNTQKLEYLSIKEFSLCIRQLIFLYLNQLCPQAILTSKKMRKQIWSEHLTKCRLLKNFIFYHMSSQTYEKELIRNDGIVKIIQSTSEDVEPSKQSN